MSNRKIEWDSYGIVNIMVFREETLEVLRLCTNIMTNKKDKFVSITSAHNEITICYDENIPVQFDRSDDHPFNKMYDEKYMLYKSSNTGSLIEESGLVNKISALFSENEIPIMYITSFNSDFIFVPIGFKNKVDRLLEVVDLKI
jgi:hypothetical protein